MTAEAAPETWPTVAFIGLGNIGLPMAVSLVKAGYRVTGYDIKPEHVAAAVAQGVVAGRSANEAAANRDIVITCLLEAKVIQHVYSGDDGGLIAHARPNSLLIDCSTTDIELARTLQQAAAAAGHDMIDAPIAGGVISAEAGTLTVMVGGTDIAFARAEPLLSRLGKSVYHMGAGGAGLAAKLCNNLVTIVTLTGLAESFALAQRLGLDPAKLFEVMRGSSSQCWALEALCPVPGLSEIAPSSRAYLPGATAHLVAKDLSTAQQAARPVNAPMPMTAAAQSLFTMLCQAGFKDLDCSSIIKVFQLEQLAGADIAPAVPTH